MVSAEYCQVANKKKYSRREAGEVINSAKRNYRGQHLKKKRAKITPQRCYKCEHCNAYHLTSSKAPYKG